jgi:hypothetical protein
VQRSIQEVESGRTPPVTTHVTNVRLPNDGFLYSRPNEIKVFKRPEEVGVHHHSYGWHFLDKGETKA